MCLIESFIEWFCVVKNRSTKKQIFEPIYCAQDEKVMPVSHKVLLEPTKKSHTFRGLIEFMKIKIISLKILSPRKRSSTFFTDGFLQHFIQTVVNCF